MFYDFKFGNALAQKAVQTLTNIVFNVIYRNDEADLWDLGAFLHTIYDLPIVFSKRISRDC